MIDFDRKVSEYTVHRSLLKMGLCSCKSVRVDSCPEVDHGATGECSLVALQEEGEPVKAV